MISVDSLCDPLFLHTWHASLQDANPKRGPGDERSCHSTVFFDLYPVNLASEDGTTDEHPVYLQGDSKLGHETVYRLMYGPPR